MEHIYPSSHDLGVVVASAIKASGKSHREVALRAGLSTTTLGRRLGGSPFRWQELSAVAQAIGRSPSSLIADAEVYRASLNVSLAV